MIDRERRKATTGAGPLPVAARWLRAGARLIAGAVAALSLSSALAQSPDTAVPGGVPPGTADTLAIQVASPPPVPQPVRSAETLQAADVPNDAGRAVRLSWEPSPTGELILERGASADGPFEEVARVAAAAGEHIDSREVVPGTTYFYRAAGIATSAIPSVLAKPQWFNMARLNLLGILLIFLALIVIYLQRARRGHGLFIRRIPGLDAMEEAIGRATEMGKAVLYVPGIDDANNIQTIYSMAILNNVAKMVARYDTELIVPVCKAFVVPLAEETVKAGYLDVGRPDAFRPENIRFLSDEQFAFTAAVNGIMLREKPAANIFLGSFFAESLVLAETGNQTGAIQIAGTANIHQLPFFVVSCDYTMIGEEFFATSAYLSREPGLVGTLKGTDAMKLLIMVFLVVGALLATFNINVLNDLLVIH